MKKYYFDTKTNTTVEFDGTLAKDGVTGENFLFTPKHEESLVEITQTSYELLSPKIKQFFSTNEEFSAELTFPVLTNINAELKKYGI